MGAQAAGGGRKARRGRPSPSQTNHSRRFPLARHSTVTFHRAYYVIFLFLSGDLHYLSCPGLTFVLPRLVHRFILSLAHSCLLRPTSCAPSSSQARPEWARARSSDVSSLTILTSLASASRVRYLFASCLTIFDNPCLVSWSTLTDTTRSPRVGEVDGKDYHFVSQDKFKDLLSQGAFIEHAQFSGNFYGTSFMSVREIEKTGRRCLLDIEAQVRCLDSVSFPLSPSSKQNTRSRASAK